MYIHLGGRGNSGRDGLPGRKGISGLPGDNGRPGVPGFDGSPGLIVITFLNFLILTLIEVIK